MSHLRDIQKLRQTRNQFPQRFSQPITSDIYNINLNNQYEQPQSKQIYNKFLQSKEILPKTRQKRSIHKRGLSNGITFYQRKQSDPINSNNFNINNNMNNNNINNNNNGLSIYQISMKLTQNNNKNKTPNPLTYRKQRKQQNIQFQSAFQLNNNFDINNLNNNNITNYNNNYNIANYNNIGNNNNNNNNNIGNYNNNITNYPLTNSSRQSRQLGRQPLILRQKKGFTSSISRNISTKSISKQLSRSNFQIFYPIGKGGFGKVWKVQHKKSKQIYALKQMYKAKIINKKSINSVMNQRKILSKLSHPFIINMTYAFQDRQNLYLIMDYLDGGDLRYHIGKKNRFTQIQSKFFIANLIIGLQYLHQNNIIHRDIKPENLVLENNGYLRITDMGISRQFKQQNYQDTSGTPGYMAPEVMVRKNHGFEVDYFAVGVIGYQFMLGKRPYIGKNRKQIRDQILAKQAGIRLSDLPKKWSIESADFINKLLTRNPSHRLGSNGIQQLKSHPWLREIDWSKLLKKQIRAPYIPTNIQQDYQQYKQQISQDTIDDNLQDNLLMLRDHNVQSLFQGYQYEKNQKDKQRSLSYMTNCTESEIKDITSATGGYSSRERESSRDRDTNRQRLKQKQKQKQRDNYGKWK